MSKNKNGSKWIKLEEKRLSESGHFRLKDTVEPNSNFINLRGNYFNKGKYKGIEVDRAPIDYLEWLLHRSTVTLNKGETKLVNKLIESKKPHL